MVSLYIVRSISDLNNGLVAKYWTVLSEAEKLKSMRFRRHKDRNRYIVTRALMRYLACELIGGDASLWRFYNGRYGKPHLLLPAGNAGFHFNLSHSDSMIVCAISNSSEVGVDIEKRRHPSDIINTAEEFFAPVEVDNLRRQPMPKQTERFIQFWTLKEAFIKAIGTGLSMPLNKFWFDLQQNKKIFVSVDSSYSSVNTNWDFFLFYPDLEYVGALAVNETGYQENITIFETVPFLSIEPSELLLCNHVKF